MALLLMVSQSDAACMLLGVKGHHCDGSHNAGHFALVCPIVTLYNYSTTNFYGKDNTLTKVLKYLLQPHIQS